MTNKLDEKWRPFPGFPDYMISSVGRCISNNPRWKASRLLKGTIARRTSNGRAVKGAPPYLYYGVGKNGDISKVLAHRAVCEAFNGAPPEEGLQVRHLDGDSLNNYFRNLCYGTPLENSADTMRHGTVPKGEQHWKSKLTDEAVNDILASDLTAVQLGTKWKVRPSTVDFVRASITWIKPDDPRKKPDYYRRGEKHSDAKMTEDAVREIRSSSKPLSYFAEKFGCTPQAVRAARIGITWKHVK